MKSKKLTTYIVLTAVVTPLMAFLLMGLLLLPVIRRYTVINNTSETFYITPLMKFGLNYDLADELERDAGNLRKYIEKDAGFSILSQYLFYTPPAFPTFKNSSIELKPRSRVVFYIDYEQLKQEGGPMVLLLKDQEGKYYYKETNFWDKEVIDKKSGLRKATDNIIRAHETGQSISMEWISLLVATFLFLLFPLLLIREVRRLKKIKELL
jgi:hypothetical protein